MTSFKDIECPICNKHFKQEPKFIKHCNIDHSVFDIKQLYLDTFFDGKELLCLCGCHKSVKWKNWKSGYISNYIQGHNARIYTYNKGKTKETDISLKNANIKKSKTLLNGFKEGKYKNWAKGLTKKTDKRLKQKGKKISELQLFSNEKVISILNQYGYILDLSDSDKFEYKGVHDKINIICTKCNNKLSKTLNNLRHCNLCYYCNLKTGRISKSEYELFSFVKSLISNNIKIDQSNRNILENKYELDIYIPEYSLAIEFNGLFWHSEKCKNINYHDDKTRQCLEKQIFLFHIFEDEWRDKKKIIKSIIKHHLSLNKSTIHSSKCELVELNEKESKIFFDNNHLEGSTSYKHEKSLGLLFNNSIVSVMSFKKTLTGDIEITKYCTKINLNVKESLKILSQKALKYSNGNVFINIDSRYENINEYKNVGFKLVKKMNIKYWWTDFKYRYNELNEFLTKIYGCSNYLMILN